MIEETIVLFNSDHSGVLSKAHSVASRRYDIFCHHRTASLYVTFLELIGDLDLSWCDDAVFMPSFMANAPMSGKKYERAVTGGNNSGKMHGLVRYEFTGCIIEECRKDDRPHGLRVVCTQMGDIWIRLHDNGARLAQIVLHADLTVQSSIDGGGLGLLQEHLHLIQDCLTKVNSKHMYASGTLIDRPRVMSAASHDSCGVCHIMVGVMCTADKQWP
jgi:hypothetical protein